jgi:flagellar biosynthesis protein FlhF
MNVQVFRGRTLKDAQRVAMQRLGSEVMILTTRTVPRTGLSGLLGGSEIEIAAVAPAKEDPARPTESLPARFAPGAYVTAQPKSSGGGDLSALRAELKGDIRTIKQMIARSDDSSVLASELGEIKDLIETMSQKAPRGDKAAAARVRALGIEGPVAAALVRALKGKPLDDEVMREVLSRSIKAAASPVESQRALIAVLGPSGVGKTTTAAKLAARARLEGRSVTLVACDRSRVGALDQLSRYADLMGAELATARNADELTQVLDEARTDLVVIDTSGRPPAPDGVEIALVGSGKTPRALARARHVLLCVPASIRAIDAARVAKRYGTIAPTSLAVTKLDETDAPTGLLHASWAAKLPISVLCFGPRVPEDIAAASSGGLLDYIAPKPNGRASAA